MVWLAAHAIRHRIAQRVLLASPTIRLHPGSNTGQPVKYHQYVIDDSSDTYYLGDPQNAICRTRLTSLGAIRYSLLYSKLYTCTKKYLGRLLLLPHQVFE